MDTPGEMRDELQFERWKLQVDMRWKHASSGNWLVRGKRYVDELGALAAIEETIKEMYNDEGEDFGAVRSRAQAALLVD